MQLVPQQQALGPKELMEIEDSVALNRKGKSVRKHYVCLCNVCYLYLNKKY